MTHPILERRARERTALLERARCWAASLADRLPDLVAVVVVGSVARGDFNVWSDTDVVVVARGLPERDRDRWALLCPLEPGIQPIAWTPAELHEARQRGNPLAIEADALGVTVHGALPPA